MDDFTASSQKAWQAILQKCKDLEASGMKRADISRLLGHKTRSAITGWLDGTTSSENASYPDMLRYISALGLDINEFLPKQLTPTIRRMGTYSPVEFVEGELISVPVFEKAGAGPAMDFFSATPDTVIRVPKKYGIHDVAAIEVTGDSMEPIIHKGAHVGVIPLDGDLQEGNIYLCRRPPFGLLVKRVLMGNNGQILLRSENPKYPDQTVEYNEYEQFIVGRVVWVLQLM